MILRRLIPSLLALAPCASAVEVQAPPVDYLQTAFRAEWRLKPLGEVLDEVQKAIEKPVVASAAVQQLGKLRLVAQVDERKSPLKDTLERLESTQELRFTAEPLRLRVETAEDVQARRRRLIELDLSEYMLSGPVTDFPGPALGLAMNMDWGDRPSGGTAGGGPAAAADDGPPGAAAVLDWLKRLALAGENASSTRTGIFIHATPEEEVALRKALNDLLGATVRQTTWRITWGMAAADAALPTGIVPAADAAKTAAGLAGRTVEVLHALAGQRVHGGQLREHGLVNDAEIVSGRMDPVSSVIVTGRCADLRTLPGRTLNLLEYRLAWVDPLPPASATLNEGPGQPRQPDKEGAAARPGPPGEQMALTLPAVWTWQPAGDVVLPHGHGLVLCAEHAQGRAVVVVEEVR